MRDRSTATLLSNVCSQFLLGDIIAPPEKLSGGALHQNWKITTSDAIYVIKKLNTQIAQKPGIKERYEETEQIATRLLEAHIPAVAALELDSHFVHHLDEHLLIVYPFVEGKIVLPEQLQPQHVEIVAQIFADIHTCHLQFTHSKSPPHYDIFKDNHWINIISRYDNPRLLSLLPTLLEWNKRYHVCIERLNQETLISHRDLHCSNVLWDEYTPHVIDWESAGYTNPLQEIIGYALEWAGIIHGQFNKELFIHLIHSYRKQIQVSATSPENAFFGWLGNSVMGWTEFNLRRAKENCFDTLEQKRGLEILEKTMIPCLSFINENTDKILQIINIQKS